MLKRLYVDNYKCLVNFSINLKELSLLLGRNGTGKSAVFDVVFALRQLLNGTARINDRDTFPSSTLTRWQKLLTQTVEFDVVLDGECYTYRLEIEHQEGHRKARIATEKLVCDGRPLFHFQQGEVSLFRDNSTPGPKYTAEWTESALARVPSRPDNRKLSRFLDFMRRILVCGLYPRSFNAETVDEDAVLTRDGANFASWYRHIFQERQDLVPDFLSDLRNVIEGFDGIRLEKVGVDARVFLIAFSLDGSRYEVRLDEISDGQRALLALYALIRVTRGQGYTLFLDEPDNYVGLSEIQPWLMALEDSCGAGVPQAVVSSHHPEIMDFLGTDSGILITRPKGGPAVVREIPQQNAAPLKLSEVVARGWAD